MSWLCPLCFTDNTSTSILDGWKCEFCSLRKDAASVNHNTLCVLHSTTAKAARAIRREGFRISKTPIAGRSMGDVIYGYVFSGGTLKGSVDHAVGVCFASDPKETTFSVFQLAFDFPISKVFVFDQVRWETLLAANKTSLEAIYSMYGKQLRDAVREYTIETRTSYSLKITEEILNDARPDDIAGGAYRLGAQAFYSPHTKIITFYDPSTIGYARSVIDGDTPAGVVGADVDMLHLQAEARGGTYYRSFWLDLW